MPYIVFEKYLMWLFYSSNNLGWFACFRIQFLPDHIMIHSCLVCEQRFLSAYMCRSLRVEILSALITELGATRDGSVYCYWHLLSHPPFILNSPLYGPKHVYIHPIIPYFLHNVYHVFFRRWSPS